MRTQLLIDYGSVFVELRGRGGLDECVDQKSLIKTINAFKTIIQYLCIENYLLQSFQFSLIRLAIYYLYISYCTGRMEIFAILYNFISALLFYTLLIILITHAITFIIRKNKPSLRIGPNSTVVIVGGCMGIGRQMAVQLAQRHQPNLLILDLRSQLFGELNELLSSYGSKVFFKQVNLADPSQVQTVIKSIKSQFKAIDLLIYNAGIVIPKRGLATTMSEHRLVMNVNYFSAIQMIQGLEDQLNGGQVAVVASMVAIILGGINYTSYGASKKAIFHYLTSLRQQFKKDRKNIGVSVACPYAINTNMFKGFKTKMDIIFPVLDEKYVGKRLVTQFLQRNEVIFVYKYMSVMFKVLELLPSQISDLMQLYLDKSDFKALQDKHKDTTELTSRKDL